MVRTILLYTCFSRCCWVMSWPFICLISGATDYVLLCSLVGDGGWAICRATRQPRSIWLIIMVRVFLPLFIPPLELVCLNCPNLYSRRFIGRPLGRECTGEYLLEESIRHGTLLRNHDPPLLMVRSSLEKCVRAMEFLCDPFLVPQPQLMMLILSLIGY